MSSEKMRPEMASPSVSRLTVTMALLADDGGDAVGDVEQRLAAGRQDACGGAGQAEGEEEGGQGRQRRERESGVGFHGCTWRTKAGGE